MSTLIKPKEESMKSPAATQPSDWTRPQAMAIPKGGFFNDKVEQGRYGPIFPKTPACYGFSVIAKVIPGREEHLYNHAKVIEKAIEDEPATLAALKAHYLRWVVFTIKEESYLMYQGIFDTDFDQYCEDASILFGKTGVQAIFEALEYRAHQRRPESAPLAARFDPQQEQVPARAGHVALAHATRVQPLRDTADRRRCR
jgi:hypothetical protein